MIITIFLIILTLEYTCRIISIYEHFVEKGVVKL